MSLRVPVSGSKALDDRTPCVLTVISSTNSGIYSGDVRESDDRLRKEPGWLTFLIPRDPAMIARAIQDTIGLKSGMESRMLRKSRALSKTLRRVSLRPQVLEQRFLLSGVDVALPLIGSAHKEHVTLEIPSTSVSQSARAIDITVMRSVRTKQVPLTSPLILNLSAFSLSPAIKRGGKPHKSNLIAPVVESVTLQAGVMKRTVAVPIVAQEPMPALVPLEITVAPRSHPRDQGAITVNLVSSSDAVPPAITSVRIVRSGSVGKAIAVTFSQPMAAETVANIYNYAVKSVPPPRLDLVALSTTSILQPAPTMTSSPQRVPLKAARYNAATHTVLLVPRSPLTPAKSFTVRSPASLGSRRTGPRIARPLTDQQGNVLNPLNDPAGSFSITISPNRPYVAPQSAVSGAT
jgi:hypothetical protein